MHLRVPRNATVEDDDAAPETSSADMDAHLEAMRRQHPIVVGEADHQRALEAYTKSFWVSDADSVKYVPSNSALQIKEEFGEDTHVEPGQNPDGTIGDTGRFL